MTTKEFFTLQGEELDDFCQTVYEFTCSQGQNYYPVEEIKGFVVECQQVGKENLPMQAKLLYCKFVSMYNVQKEEDSL